MIISHFNILLTYIVTCCFFIMDAGSFSILFDKHATTTTMMMMESRYFEHNTSNMNFGSSYESISISSDENKDNFFYKMNGGSSLCLSKDDSEDDDTQEEYMWFNGDDSEDDDGTCMLLQLDECAANYLMIISSTIQRTNKIIEDSCLCKECFHKQRLLMISFAEFFFYKNNLNNNNTTSASAQHQHKDIFDGLDMLYQYFCFMSKNEQYVASCIFAMMCCAVSASVSNFHFNCLDNVFKNVYISSQNINATEWIENSLKKERFIVSMIKDMPFGGCECHSINEYILRFCGSVIPNNYAASYAAEKKNQCWTMLTWLSYSKKYKMLLYVLNCLSSVKAVSYNRDSYQVADHANRISHEIHARDIVDDTAYAIIRVRNGRNSNNYTQHYQNYYYYESEMVFCELDTLGILLSNASQMASKICDKLFFGDIFYGSIDNGINVDGLCNLRQCYHLEKVINQKLEYSILSTTDTNDDDHKSDGDHGGGYDSDSSEEEYKTLLTTKSYHSLSYTENSYTFLQQMREETQNYVQTYIDCIEHVLATSYTNTEHTVRRFYEKKFDSYIKVCEETNFSLLIKKMVSHMCFISNSSSIIDTKDNIDYQMHLLFVILWNMIKVMGIKKSKDLFELYEDTTVDLFSIVKELICVDGLKEKSRCVQALYKVICYNDYSIYYRSEEAVESFTPANQIIQQCSISCLVHANTEHAIYLDYLNGICLVDVSSFLQQVIALDMETNLRYLCKELMTLFGVDH